MSILHLARPKCQWLPDTAMMNTIAFISIVQRVLAVGEDKGGHIEEVAIPAPRRPLRVVAASVTAGGVRSEIDDLSPWDLPHSEDRQGVNVPGGWRRVLQAWWWHSSM